MKTPDNDKIGLEEIFGKFDVSEKTPAIPVKSKLPKTDTEFEADALEFMSAEENKNLQKLSEERENEGVKKAEAIINIFDKNSENYSKDLQYIKDKEEKIEKKLQSETDDKKRENLQKMLDELNQMGVQAQTYEDEMNKIKAQSYDYKKNIKSENVQSASEESEVIDINKKEHTLPDIEVKNKTEEGQIVKIEEETPPVVEVMGELPELNKFIDSKEKLPNPSLKELSDRVENALGRLETEEKQEIMTKPLFDLLDKVKNDKENTIKPVSETVLEYFDSEIQYIEKYADKMEKRRELDSKYEPEVDKIIGLEQREDSESRKWNLKAKDFMDFERREGSNKREEEYNKFLLPDELPPLPDFVELKTKEYSKKIEPTVKAQESIENKEKEEILEKLKDKRINVSKTLVDIIKNPLYKIENIESDTKFIKISLKDLGLKSYPNKKITLEEIYRVIDKYEKRLPEEKYGLETISASKVFESCLNIEKPTLGKKYFIGINTINKDSSGDRKIVSLMNNFNKITVTDTDMDVAGITDLRNDPEVFNDTDIFIFKKKKLVSKK